MTCEIQYAGGHEWFCETHGTHFFGPAGPDINDDGDEPVSCVVGIQEEPT